VGIAVTTAASSSITCEHVGSALHAVAEKLDERHRLAQIVRVFGREQELLLHYVAQLQKEKKKKKKRV
jgi:hypothetical protein